MPPRKPRKKKAPKVQKQKQKQRQSVVVNINQQRKTVARQPRKLTELHKPVQPSSISFSPMINFPQQYDNTSSIMNAIKALEYRQPEVVRDVAKVDVAEQVFTPLRDRVRAAAEARANPQISGLASQEFYEVLREPIELPPEIPFSVESGGLGILAPEIRSQFPVPPVEETVAQEISQYKGAEELESEPIIEKASATSELKELVKQWNAGRSLDDPKRVSLTSNKTDEKLRKALTAKGITEQELRNPFGTPITEKFPLSKRA